ncbi:MAG: hypothetical protein KatS3mg108_0856 [Isosphaeraceae bacterium]|jgi:Flp pilus assembly pilin Flp|nr:MAG: hypothetical protein KatS3mg108_0856 [Isosphaeraceae bacterium]
MKVEQGRAIRCLVDDDGPTTVEYAVLLGLILMVAMTAIRSLGGGTEGRWRSNADKIRSAISLSDTSSP